MTLSSTTAQPGRPREFDVDEAVNSAMHVFWSRGYTATSLVDLLDGTGLSRGSLYKAFGDKRGIFLKALEIYVTTASERLVESLQGPGTSIDRIQRALSRYADMSCGTEGKRGCLLLATANEMLPHDAEVSKCVSAMFDQMRKSLANAIQRGQLLGEIKSTQDPQTLARLLVCLVQGMRALGKAGMKKAEAAAVVDSAMKLLD